MGTTASSSNNNNSGRNNNNKNKNNNNMSTSSSSYIRKAYHAGSWYQNSSKQLDETLDGFLNNVDDATSDNNNNCSLRALICPHAGYSYSGPTAAYSYHALRHELQKQDTPIRSILVLHPAHHVYLPGCAISGATQLETPLGNLPVNDALRQELLLLTTTANGKKNFFSIMDESDDNQEHSGEMQYPFVAKCTKEANKLNNITVLPIMCGALSDDQEATFGKLLAPTIHRSDILTIISSDFCHWGSRFRYQPTGGSSGMPIHEFIQQMDKKGMDLIELQQPGAFAEYLKRTRNTICGRHPIGVYLNAAAATTTSDANNNNDLEVKFIKYAQSSAVQSMSDSSVSYASAVVVTAK